MYNIVRIHAQPVALPDNVIRVSTLSTIPEELRGSIQVINCKICLNDEDGPKIEPTGSLIAYKKTPGGYNCWAVAGPHANIIQIGESLYVKPPKKHAILIPTQEEVIPLWAQRCNLTYNGDGTATLKTESSSITGRIGIDFLVCEGMGNGGKFFASILTREDPSYGNYLVSNDAGTDIGRLCELYPA